MTKIKTLISDLNNLKERAEFIADHMVLLAKDEFRVPVNGSFVIEEDFTWKSIIKFIFNGSSRLQRLISSINVVFDKIEEDIEEIFASKTDTPEPEETNVVTEIKEEV